MRPKKVDSINLAEYIIAKTGSMTHLKLQKLVYYVEAYHLAYFGKSLIDDQFEAWLHGPVSRKLWNYLKPIANVYDNVRIEGNKNDFIKSFEKKVTPDQLDLINDVLHEYGKESSYALECMTHAEDPWRKARKGRAMDDKCNEIIDKDVMRQYYKQNLYQ